MSGPRRRPWLAVLGALIFWSGVSMLLLTVIGTIGLLVEGRQPAWWLYAVFVGFVVVGRVIVRVSRVPFGEASNL